MFCLIASGCTLGGPNSSCHGLCNNSLINIPDMCLNCYNGCLCSSCNTTEFKEMPFTDEDYTFVDASVCENSEGNGQNGYVTVKLRLDFPALETADVHYVTYKVNVYDNGVLAGSAIVVRSKEEIKQLLDTYKEYVPIEGETLIADAFYVDYFNVEITNYISGQFTCELEYVQGRYIK